MPARVPCGGTGGVCKRANTGSPLPLPLHPAEVSIMDDCIVVFKVR